ncbi:prepilin peptidase [Myxococcota bacterium]|nr:prepilin peptidase [Myxococcota bacterium]
MGEVAALPTIFFVVSALVFGLVVGSFLNVVIHRLPRGESLVRPRSRCPHCSQAVSILDNIPVVSYLRLGGRCRHCRTRISLRYPAIEILTGLLWAGLVFRFGVHPMTFVWMLFSAALVAAAVIDFDHRIIPDEISIGGLVVAVMLVPVAHALDGSPFTAAFMRSLIGALVGGGLLWSVAFVHARVCAALGRHFDHWPGEGESFPTVGQLDYWTWFPGLGLGDVKLLAMIGAVQGALGALATLVLASVAGLALGIAWAMTTRRWGVPFGFAPAIAAGALLVVFLPGAL